MLKIAFVTYWFCTIRISSAENFKFKTKLFYDSLSVEINQKKTKVMIFNGRGLKLANYNFSISNRTVEVVDTYQYLGINLKPSGSMQFAVSELYDKASRAWYAISNVLYKYKRLDIDRAFMLFDSLIRPVALFSAEFWQKRLAEVLGNPAG